MLYNSEMDDQQTPIKFNVDSWKIKIRERRNNRMRFQINLSKDEALAYKNFGAVCKPQEVSESDFLKTIFLTGIEAMNKELAQLVKQYAKENKEDLASSGITVLEDEDGEIRLAPTDVIDSETSGSAGVAGEGHQMQEAISKVTENK